MAMTRKCCECGASLPADAPRGVCPSCELRGALEVEAVASGECTGGLGSTPRPDASRSPVFPASVHHFGDYELLEEIARGGMGIVYRARQISLNRPVALKLLPFSALTTAEFIKRFRAEASAAAALRHPNIVTVHEVGVIQGQQYLVMDFINGPPLSRLVADGPLPAKRAAAYLKVIAEAVHYAHEHGILHRDLKPSNVLIDENDQPQVTDFGLAKRLDGESSLTLSGQALGSPGYMPPEQAAAQHSKVTRRSDVYGLGAVLYHLLTGRPPFQAGTLHEAIQQVVATEPLAPRLLNPSVPRDLQTICLKCLEKEPERRYDTARALADEVQRFLNGEPILARPVGALGKSWRWCRRNPVVAGLGTAVLLLLVVVAFGSSVAAWRLEQEQQRTRAALWQALFSQAQQRRRASGTPGQRLQTLEALAQAAAIRPAVELRNEALAAMALPDLRELDRLSCPAGASLAFSASLETYAQFVPSESQDKSISVHRSRDRAELLRVPFESPGSPMFALSSSGRFLVLSVPRDDASSACEVWDVPARRRIIETHHAARGFPVRFDRSERQFFIGHPARQLLAFNLSSPTNATAYDLGFAASMLSLHPEGRFLAAAPAFATQVTIFDLADGARSVAQLPHPLPVFSDLDWSPDGRHLAVACGHGNTPCSVQIWAWQDNQAQAEKLLQGHQASIVFVRFMPDGDLLWTHSHDETTRLWSAHLGRQLLEIPLRIAVRHPAGPRLAFQATPTSYSRQELVTGEVNRLLIGCTGDQAPECVSISPDGAWVAAAARDGVRLWHAPSGRELAFLPGQCSSLLFHPRDGDLVVAAGDRVVRWPLRRSAPEEMFVLGPPEVLSPSRPRGRDFHVACSPDGARLAWVAGTYAEVMDWENPTRRTVIPHNAALRYVAVSPGGDWAATCGGGPSQIWSLNPIAKVKELSRPGYAMAAFSPDGQWLVLSDRSLSAGIGGGRHRVYRVGSWDLVAEVPMDHGPLAAHAFSPDGRLLAVRASHQTVMLLETARWTELGTLEHPLQKNADWIAFSFDGALVALAGETHFVQLWNLREARKRLAEAGLNWDQPPFLPAPPASATPPGLLVRSPSD